MINFSLAREIYGKSPLLVDGATFSTFSNLLSDLRSGLKIDEKEVKLNNICLYDLKSEVMVIDSTYDLKQQAPDSELVYVINLNGPITKSGGLSSYGTKELADQMTRFDADSRIKGGVIVTDSGGGSGYGMEVMVYAISQLKKPVVSLVERAGCACSAAYGIVSATDYIMAESAETEVGSIGTMVSFAGFPDKSVGADGAKHITIYATASTKKNLWFEEALNNDNYKLAKEDFLDPFNERFMDMIKANRPGVLKTQLDGSVYPAGDVLGSLVDEIGDFTAAVNKVLELSSITPIVTNKNSKNDKTKNTAMTASEIKAAHPGAYAEIFGVGQAAGVAAEKSRTGVWLAHLATDQEAVIKGIKSGEEISAEAREELLIKGLSSTHLKNLKSDSAAAVLPKEATSEEAVVTEEAALYSKVLKSIKEN